MLTSHITVIADSKNVDSNSIEEISEAIRLFDATDVQVSTDGNGVIEAWVPYHKIADISLITGVGYIRNHFTYNRKIF